MVQGECTPWFVLLLWSSLMLDRFGSSSSPGPSSLLAKVLPPATRWLSLRIWTRRIELTEFPLSLAWRVPSTPARRQASHGCLKKRWLVLWTAHRTHHPRLHSWWCKGWWWGSLCHWWQLKAQFRFLFDVLSALQYYGKSIFPVLSQLVMIYAKNVYTPAVLRSHGRKCRNECQLAKGNVTSYLLLKSKSYIASAIFLSLGGAVGWCLFFIFLSC